jgi:tubulin alpha
MSPAECVFIHIGQCGVRTGHSLWELFCLEHGISYDGTLEQGETTDDMELATTTSFFSPTHTSGCLRVTPRSLFVDTEPDSCNEIRCGRYRGLFRQSQLLSGKEDAADNYARGYYNSGKAFLETMTDAIRRLAEQCDGLQGFIIGGATGGGTGSAFTSLLLQHIAVEHGRKSKVTMSILPAHHIFSAVTAPYNNLMALQNLSEYADACFCFDNESLFRICERNFEPERQRYGSLRWLPILKI